MKEKVFIRRLEYAFRSGVIVVTYDSFNDIWSTVGCYGFSPYCYKVRIPYKIDFVVDFFGDDILYGPSVLHWNKDKSKLKGISNGNKFLRTDLPLRKVYSDEFINRMMKENFPSFSD